MISLSQIEQDLTTAMKAKDQMAVNVLRGLKTRIQNEQIAKTKPELSEQEIFALIRSEVKRRKEAAESFALGGRAQQAEAEQKEAGILQKYLPAQMPETELTAKVEKFLAENNFTVQDFGKAMGGLKQQLGDHADGALLAKLLKEKLK